MLYHLSSTRSTWKNLLWRKLRFLQQCFIPRLEWPLCLPLQDLPDSKSDGLIHVKVLTHKLGAQTPTFPNFVYLQCFCPDCRPPSHPHPVGVSVCVCVCVILRVSDAYCNDADNVSRFDSTIPHGGHVESLWGCNYGRRRISLQLSVEPCIVVVSLYPGYLWVPNSNTLPQRLNKRTKLTIICIYISWNKTRPRAPAQNQQTREFIIQSDAFRALTNSFVCWFNNYKINTAFYTTTTFNNNKKG